MSVKVGTVVLDIAADTAKLVSGMNQAQKTVKKSVDGMKTAIIGMVTAYAGLEGVRAFRGMVNDSLDAADATGKLAQKLGLASNTLSEYQYAAGFAAIEQKELSAGLSALIRRLNNFQRDGGGAAAKGFAAIGVSMEYAREHYKTTDDAFKDILKRLEQMPDGFKKTAAAQDIFSKNASSILRLTHTDLVKFSEEAERIGITIPQHVYEMAAVYHDEMDRLDARFEGIKNTVSSGMLPAMTAAAKTAVQMYDEMFGGSATDQMTQFGDIAIDAIENIVRGAGFIKDSWTGIRLVLTSLEHGFYTLAWGVSKAFEPIVWMVNGLIDGYNALGEVLRYQKIDFKLESNAPQIEEEMAELKQKADELIASLSDGRITADEFTKKLKSNFEEIKKKAKEAADASKDLNSTIEDAPETYPALELDKETLNIVTQYDKAMAKLPNTISSVNNEYMAMYNVIKDLFTDDQMTLFFSQWQKDVEGLQDPIATETATWSNTFEGQLADASINAFKDKRFGEAFSALAIQLGTALQQDGLGDLFSGSGGLVQGLIGDVTKNKAGDVTGISGGLGGWLSGSLGLEAGLASGFATAGVGLAISALPSLLGGLFDDGPSRMEKQLESIKAELEKQTEKLQQQISFYSGIGATGSKLLSERTLATKTYEAADDSLETEMFGSSGYGGSYRLWLNQFASTDAEGSRNGVNVAALNEYLGSDFTGFSGAMDNFNLDAATLAPQVREFLSPLQLLDEFFKSGVYSEADYEKIKERITRYTEEYANALVSIGDQVADVTNSLNSIYMNITGEDIVGDAYLGMHKEQLTNLGWDGTKEGYTDLIRPIIEGGVEVMQEYGKLRDDLMSDDIKVQDAAVHSLSQITGKYFDTSEEALNYIKSLDAVGQAYVNSEMNIRAWENSFLSAEEQAQNMADTLGVDLAANTEELDDLYLKLANDTDGLTDSELNLLNANKKLIETRKEETDAIEAAQQSSIDYINTLGMSQGEQAAYHLAQKGIFGASTQEDIYAAFTGQSLETIKQWVIDNPDVYKDPEVASLINRLIGQNDALNSETVKIVSNTAAIVNNTRFGALDGATATTENIKALFDAYGYGDAFIQNQEAMAREDLERYVSTIIGRTYYWQDGTYYHSNAEGSLSAEQGLDFGSLIADIASKEIEFRDLIAGMEFSDNGYALDGTIINEWLKENGAYLKHYSSGSEMTYEAFGAASKLPELMASLVQLAEYDDSYASMVQSLDLAILGMGDMQEFVDMLSSEMEGFDPTDPEAIKELFGLTEDQMASFERLLSTDLADAASDAADGMDDLLGALDGAASSFGNIADTARGFVDWAYANNASYNGGLYRSTMAEAMQLNSLISGGGDYTQDDLDRFSDLVGDASQYGKSYLGTFDTSSFDYRFQKAVMANQFREIEATASANEKTFADVVQSIQDMEKTLSEQNETIISLSERLADAQEKIAERGY